MLNHRRLRSPSCRSGWTPLPVLLVFLALPVVAWAESQSDRELARLNSDVDRMSKALVESPPKLPELSEKTPFDKLAKDQSLSRQARACWLLVEDQLNLVTNLGRPDNLKLPAWYPFADSRQDSGGREQRLKDCYELPGKFKENMVVVIEYYCKVSEGSPKTVLQQTQICRDWMKRLNGQGELPPLRKGLGGFSVGLGVASIVLGVVHLAFPLFKLSTESTLVECSANGLRVPCVAGRYELGGALIGIGAVTAGLGGGLTLGLRL